MRTRAYVGAIGAVAAALATAYVMAGAGTAWADTQDSTHAATSSNPGSSSRSHGSLRPKSSSPAASRRGDGSPASAGTSVTQPDRTSDPNHPAMDHQRPASIVGRIAASARAATERASEHTEQASTTSLARPAASGLAVAATPNDVEPSQARQASFGQILNYTLFNVTPTLNPAQLDGQSPDGAVTGNLNAVGSDGAVLTYTVTEIPENGTVSVLPDGSYTYTPNSEWARVGGTDHFSVNVDGGSAFRLNGIPGALQRLLHSLAQFVGLSAADTAEARIYVSVSAISQPPTTAADPPEPTDSSTASDPGDTEPGTPESVFTDPDDSIAPVSDEHPTTIDPAADPVPVSPAPDTASIPPHLGLAERMVNEILPENNSYRNGTPTVRFTGVDGATSMFNESDCSSFVTELLQAAYNLTDAQFSAWTGFRRPGPQHYYDIAMANKGFVAYSNVNSIGSGDLFIIKYTGSQEANGHIVVITAPPTFLGISSRSAADGLMMYRLPILDVTSSPHGSSDSRAATHQDGIGTGFMRLYTDSDGNLVTYQWNNYSNGVIYSTSDRLAMFARIELPTGN